MDNNDAKQTTSSFTQPNYGANYYAPPSMFEMNSSNNTNDFEPKPTKNTKNLNLFPGTDLDAERAQRAEKTQAHKVDQAGMYVPILPKKEEAVKLTVHPNHACTKCYDCQMRIQRETEEKRKKEQECLESCNAFCEMCGAVLMCCEMMMTICSMCDAAK